MLAVELSISFIGALILQGLYAMSMNCMEAAEAQFKTALSVSTEVRKSYLSLKVVRCIDTGRD